MLLFFAAFAHASTLHDVSILAMADYRGASTYTGATDDYVSTGYHQVVQELGLTVANKPMTPAETLGINGFSIQFGNTVSFIRTGTTDGSHPAGWDLADTNETPPYVLFVPWVQVQKGLPASLEVGANFGWIGETRTGTFGFNGRWAPLEGYRQLPDIAFSVGYAGYIGNDELELGVMDMGATLGYTLPFGVTQGIHQAQFSPFVGVSQDRIHAAPRVDLTDTGLEDSIGEVSGFRSSDSFDKTLAPIVVNGGFRIQNGSYSATFSAAYAPNILPTVNVGLGFVY